MIIVNIYEAKTHLSQLVDAARRGEEIIITKAGKPVVKLCPLSIHAISKPIFGVLQTQLIIADDFDSPLPDNYMSVLNY